MTKEFIFIMDLMGTVAFAISGSMTAVEQGMDLFGILILALTTATGGGFIRDLTIGSLPPVVFRNPIYMILSFLTAGIVFLVLKFLPVSSLLRLFPLSWMPVHPTEYPARPVPFFHVLLHTTHDPNDT